MKYTIRVVEVVSTDYCYIKTVKPQPLLSVQCNGYVFAHNTHIRHPLHFLNV